MNIKLGKFEANVSGIMLFVVATIADNMYANHCRKKAINKYMESVVELEKVQEKEKES